jgi:hypothetical protein
MHIYRSWWYHVWQCPMKRRSISFSVTARCGSSDMCNKMLDSTNCAPHEDKLFCKNCHGRKYGKIPSFVSYLVSLISYADNYSNVQNSQASIYNIITIFTNKSQSSVVLYTWIYENYDASSTESVCNTYEESDGVARDWPSRSGNWGRIPAAQRVCLKASR